MGQIENKKTTDLNTTISLITLNKNKTNTPIKREIVRINFKNKHQHRQFTRA